MKEERHEVLVIGGGPAGSAAAAILAGKGRRVLVLEKHTFPRYHVGESLVPFCYFPLLRLGLLDKMKSAPFQKKYSVQFVSMNGRVAAPFYFHQHLDHACTATWQVVRSEFDQLLLDHAREKGAAVREGMRVQALRKEGEAVVGVHAVDRKGRAHEFRAPLTIDASGREALSAARSGWRVRDPKLNKIAIWTYYKGARRDPGMDEGATTVAYLPEKGWFWYLPLQNDTVSVGLVAGKEYLYTDTRDPAAILAREAKKNRWIAEHLAGGVPFGPHWVTGEFSYRSRYCAADGLVLTGDAFAFLDPVFSSGVFLALQGGVMAGEAVDRALAEGTSSAGAFGEYGAELCKGIEAMRKLVYAFYDRGFRFKSLLAKHPELRGALTDCLIGDLFRDFGPLFRGLEEFARLPGPLPHGRPLLSRPEGTAGSESIKNPGSTPA